MSSFLGAPKPFRRFKQFGDSLLLCQRALSAHAYVSSRFSISARQRSCREERRQYACEGSFDPSQPSASADDSASPNSSSKPARAKFLRDCDVVDAEYVFLAPWLQTGKDIRGLA